MAARARMIVYHVVVRMRRGGISKKKTHEDGQGAHDDLHQCVGRQTEVPIGGRDAQQPEVPTRCGCECRSQKVWQEKRPVGIRCLPRFGVARRPPPRAQTSAGPPPLELTAGLILYMPRCASARGPGGSWTQGKGAMILGRTRNRTRVPRCSAAVPRSWPLRQVTVAV